MKDKEIKKIQEKIRKRSKIIIGILTIVFIIVLIPLVMCALKEEDMIAKILMILSFIFLVFVVEFAAYFTVELIVNGKDTNYVAKEAKEYAIEYIEETTKKEDPIKDIKDVKYDEKGLPKERIKNMINPWNYYTSNDYIEGKYKDIHFEFADVFIGQDFKDGETAQRKFLGRVLIFDSKEKKSLKVHIETKRFACSKPLHTKVDIKDESFSKIFNVSAENEKDAYSLLTPTLIKKIINLKNNDNCDIVVDFRDGKIFLAINNKKDAFQFDGYKEVNSEIIREQDNKEIESIKAIIDDFID